MNKKQNRKSALFFVLGFVGVMAFFLVPLCVCVYFSFNATSVLGNYEKVLQSQAFRLVERTVICLTGRVQTYPSERKCELYLLSSH